MIFEEWHGYKVGVGSTYIDGFGATTEGSVVPGPGNLYVRYGANYWGLSSPASSIYNTLVMVEQNRNIVY